MARARRQPSSVPYLANPVVKKTKMRKKESVMLVVQIEPELNQQLRELSGGEYGAWTALGVEILTEAVNNYNLTSQVPPPKQSSVERHTLRVPPELGASLKRIAAAEERMQKVVIGRMLKEGVERRLSKKDEKKT